MAIQSNPQKVNYYDVGPIYREEFVSFLNVTNSARHLRTLEANTRETSLDDTQLKDFICTCEAVASLSQPMFRLKNLLGRLTNTDKEIFVLQKASSAYSECKSLRETIATTYKRVKGESHFERGRSLEVLDDDGELNSGYEYPAFWLYHDDYNHSPEPRNNRAPAAEINDERKN